MKLCGLILALALAGCGGAVSGEGTVDQNGCPGDPPAGVTGTGLLIGSNCAAAQSSAEITDGKTAGMSPKSATLLGLQDGMCHFEVIFDTGSCTMDYDVSVPVR